MFGAVSLNKNADIDQYKYSGYGIGFDRKGEFSFGNGFGRNCIIFGADLNSSSHVDNKKIIIFLFLVNVLYKEEMVQQFMQKNCIQLILLKKNKKICLSLHYNGANSCLFVNGTEINKLKTKDSEIVVTSLCVGNILKDFSVDNIKKNRIKWICFYDFSLDYDAIAVDDILDIHKYLMEKNGIVQNVWIY